MRALSAALLITTMAAGPALSSDLTVSVRSPQGAAVRDVVITLYPAAGAGGARPDALYRMVQHDLQFDPFVLVVPLGATVSFPNQDNVRHHVYSFSPAKTFELKLYGRDETRQVKFDRAGVVALGCNIHDNMVAFIKVVDTPFAAKIGAQGDVSLRGVPAGPAVMHVWHPYLKAPGNEVVRDVVLPPSGEVRTSVTVDLRPPAPRRSY
jgi:plastocyanin